MEEEMPNKLIIIGNGFDKAHSIESGYADFKTRVAKQGNQRLINLMDIFFSNQQEFWGNVEEAMGEYDEDSILDFCKPDKDFDYDHSLRSVANIEDAPNSVFIPVMSEFFDVFVKWVSSIDISNAHKMIDLPSNAKYLTFNYTETLESVYHIPSNKILHVHGSRINDKNYIFGHCNARKEDSVYDDDSKLFCEQNALRTIIATMNGYKKDTSAIIRNHSEFFDSLNNIKQVVVYGMSYSLVDRPYFMEIVQKVDTDVPWHLSWHTGDDYAKLKEFVSAAGLKNIKPFEW